MEIQITHMSAKKVISKKRKYEDAMSSYKPARTLSLSNQRVFKTKRTFTPAALAQDISFVSRVFTFKLSDVPDYTEFTSLFDLYKIDKISVTVLPRVSEWSGTDMTGYLFSVMDYDGGAVSSRATMFSYDNFQVTPFNKNRTFTFKPRTLQFAQGSALNSVSKPSQWLDCNSPGVEHFGLVLGCDSIGGAGSGQGQTWDLFIDYHMSFKTTR